MLIQKILYKHMLKTALLSTLLLGSAYASSFTEYKHATQQQFSKEKSHFTNYKKAQKQAFENYKKELQKYWQKPIVTTKKQLVTYSKNNKSRSLIDFAHNELTVQTLAKNEKEAQSKLELALAKAVTFNTQDFYRNDAFEQQLAKLEAARQMPLSKITTEPVLAPILFKEKPTKQMLYSFVKAAVSPKKISVKNSPRLNNEKVYTLHIKLPNDTTIKRSRVYYNTVKKEAVKQRIELALVFAIIHSESSFNPMARSYVPAYGLMQIVPQTAGIDSYYYLYKRKRLVGSSYLYNAQNNIKMGSAYLHILYYKYLKYIKNPTSRLYCTIAAYNTGAGNVSRAFVRTNDTYRAAQVINRLSPDEVYARLLQDLPYNESKRYLRKVTKRVEIYRRIYES